MPNKKELFRTASAAYFGNRPKELRKIVHQLLHYRGLDLLERRQLSNYLNILGQSDQALRVLGRILGPYELKTADPIQIAIQADIASKLVFHSANYTAKRIFENIESNPDFDFTKHPELEKWPFYKGQFLSYTYRSEESLPILQTAIDYYPENSPEFKFGHLIFLKSLIDSTQYDKALALCEKFSRIFAREDKRFLVYLEALKAEANLDLGNIDQAKRLYLECIEMEKDNRYQPTVATFYRAMGDISRLEGNEYQSSKYYTRARRILEKFPHGPVFNWFPLIYSIEALSTIKHTFKHQLFLRLFPTHDPYIRLIEGARIEAAIPPYNRGQFSPHSGDSWIIHRNQILGEHYLDFLKLPLKKNQNVFDLVSGRFKAQATHRFQSLSLKQSRCLRALLGSGHVGIKHFHLMDYVYRQDFVDLESGQARLNKLIAHLRKLGLKITLKRTRYFFEPQYNDIYICSKLNRDPHPLFGLTLNKTFTRQAVEDFLGVKRSRAGGLIAEWIDQSLVQALPNSEYEVIDPAGPVRKSKHE